MAQMKTPGVYIVEKNAFPNSVVEVSTAVPAFIGHTEMANHAGTILCGRPWRISSMAEYHQCFGFGPTPLFDIMLNAGSPSDTAFQVGGQNYQLTQPDGKAGGRYVLYYSLLHFFQNGGGPCYIVSVGDYQTDVDGGALRTGIDRLIKEQEPTMVVIPEAVLLEQPECIAVQQAMLRHCGRMKSRVSILDIREGWKSQKDSNCVANFRNSLGIDDLDFGAVYYPWVNTTIIRDKDLSFENISPASRDLLIDLLKEDLGLERPLAASATPKQQQQSQLIDTIRKDFTVPAAGGPPLSAATVAADKATFNRSLAAISGLFRTILTVLKDRLNLLPPSGAMAGIYTMVDNTRGVWKAPANVSMNSVVSPAVNVSHEEQEELNVNPQGKSINAIRSFIGEGVLVWGARTLDGNSLDWRYINVRRTMIMLEESCRLAAQAMVFEPNTASTWVTIKAMISDFLTGIWKRGGLAGAVPEDAFSVHVGLGETMTPEDVLEGILRVTVLVAVSRPAEFIEITFRQQMQKS
jgi:phage tail sheath protein FI